MKNMKNTILKRAVFWILIGLLPATTVTVAQPAGKAETGRAGVEKKSPDLIRSAEYIKKKFEELLASMSEIANLMEKTEPDVAKILRRTVEHAQRQLVTDKMSDVVRDLKKGLDEAARQGHSEVIEHLTKMLRIIEGGMQEKSDTDVKLEALRAVKEQMEKIIERQQEEKTKTDPKANAEDIDGQTRKLIEGIEDAIRKQKKLNEETDKVAPAEANFKKLAGLRRAVRSLLKKQEKVNASTRDAALASLPVLAEAQRKLADIAGQLQEKLASAGNSKAMRKALAKAGVKPETLETTAGLAGSAGGEMKQAAGALDKSSKAQAGTPQAQAMADLQSADRALTDAMRKLSAGTPSGKLADRQGDLSKQTKKLAGLAEKVAKMAGIDPKGKEGEGKGGLNKAAGHMAKASGKLSAAEKKPARCEQDQALSELQKQLTRAAELRRKAMDLAKKKMDSTEQQQIAKDVNKLADRMKSGQDKKPMPGQKSAGKAGQCAGSAAGKMGQCDAKGANKDQKEALEEMKKALEELDEEIAKLERRAKAEKLAKIEDRLEKILEEQKKCTTRTRKTYENRQQGKTPYDREAGQALLELSKSEGGLAEEVAAIRQLLIKEGSTVVFPEVLGDVKQDLSDVQKRLADRDPGPLTQTTQEEIETVLEELIDSVRKELSKGPGRKKGGGGKGGGQCNKKPPLIPPLAELRMLRLQEVRIRRSTERLNEQATSGKLTAEQVAANTKKLADRQQRVIKLATEMAEKLKAGPKCNVKPE
jgi:hypothetical protein